VEGGENGGAIQDGGSTSLPSFRSLNGGDTLRATINHYMATSNRLQCWGWLFCYAIGRMSKTICLKGFSMPAYKGAWHGHHDGTGVDTIWSPVLSPIKCRVLQGNPPWACLQIRHKLPRPVLPWAFQQLGCPVGNTPYHLQGPPWLSDLGLRRWYTYLVHPQ
jgi:hypothetical protein